MCKQSLFSGIALLLAALALGRAEESMNPVQTTLSSTTLSGYVDTSAGWNENAGTTISNCYPPQVATNKLRKIPNWGTDILHYFVRDSFANSGILSNASGYLDLRQQAQGHSQRQQAGITLRKLETNANWTLLSAKLGDTNYTEVTTFNSDRKGSARLSFRWQSNGNGKSKGKGPSDLPESLSPVIELASLGIVNASTQLVMHANLLEADRMQYHIKRKMDGHYGVGGLLHLSGTTKKTVFRLQALNLLPSHAYWLSFDGVVVSTNATDRNGNLRIYSQLTPAITPFTLTTIELLDTGTNQLLHTELP